MSFQNLQVKEQVTKKVVNSGNGGCVWLPKAWVGNEVVVILPKTNEQDIKYEILKLFGEALPKVQAVFLYGSFARNEQQHDSDIDVLVVVNDNVKLKFPTFAINSHKIDIKIIESSRLRKSIENNPIMYISLITEAKPILNAALLEELRSIKVDKKKFKWFIEDTKEHIESNKEFIELDKLDGNFLKSYVVAYSLILRLRGIYLIECLLHNRKYSNKDFAEFVVVNSKISLREFNEIYSIYKLIRDEKKISKLEIKLETVEKLLDFLANELQTLKK
ncbi:nucleotidyltransferase domain-containing protein [Candidatus Woesearchaeota archaeon]|nr:nucleotidyltransferase domain-containing protein [Candidatus Woesearchaeota archaeon]